MDRDALEIGRIAIGEHGDHAVYEVGSSRQIGRRIPAQAVRCQRLLDRTRSEQLCTFVPSERPMIGGRTQAVQPAAAIFVARGGERGSRKLLGIQTERRSLRAIAPIRKRALDSLRFEMATEAAQVAEITSLHQAALEPEAHKFKRAQPLLELRPRRAGLAYRAFPAVLS